MEAPERMLNVQWLIGALFHEVFAKGSNLPGMERLYEHHVQPIIPHQSLLLLRCTRVMNEVSIAGSLYMAPGKSPSKGGGYQCALEQCAGLERWLETRAPVKVGPQIRTASSNNQWVPTEFADSVAHGWMESDQRNFSFFLLSNAGNRSAAREAEMMCLLSPCMHQLAFHFIPPGRALLSGDGVPSRDLSALAPGDAELLHWLSLGRTNKDIGAILGLSDKTVRNRLSLMYERLHVSSRAEAVGAYLLAV
ncbi:helix-turn-helix domain-containing protein [Roseateles chitinivorans]|uniref:helix-turn-helix domain-containing protein n=1 Tax=Roseateles chitinivorans TaxID=2917965 RepID=UPI003D676D27